MKKPNSTAYEAWFDGACEPINPGGTASYGIALECNGETIHEGSGKVGSGPQMSNNVAEYSAINEILGYLLAIEAKGEVTIYGDSKLVVQQLNGRWKAYGGLYLEFYKRAVELLNKLKQSCDVTIQWIPREQNERCDQLSKSV